MGRPPKTEKKKEAKLNLRVDDEFLRELDELRRDEPDGIPSRSELLRRLVKRAIAAKRTPKKS